MDEAERKALREEWLRNEAELLKLRDLPVGRTDPAAREDELEGRQDEIERRLGCDTMARRMASDSE